MKTFLTLFLFVASMLFAHAAAEAGDSTANLYQSDPNPYIDDRVDIEISHVEIVPAVKSIEGLSFIFANTYDFENHCDGGKMLIIVLEKNSEKIRRRYGTIIDKDSSGKPETKRLRGTLRLVGDSFLFMEASDDVLEIVQAHYDSQA